MASRRAKRRVFASSCPILARRGGAQIVYSATAGAVITSVVVAKGVFHGTGRIAEKPSRPGDPANTNRDDLVFADGKMRIISTILAAPFVLNPHSCLLGGTVEQTGKIVGGTGQFAAATGRYTATVKARVLLARNRDGSCSFRHVARHEVDKIAASGTLSF